MIFVEDYVAKMIKIKEKIKIECVLFDRGFGWGVIYKLKELKVNYIVFWKKAETGTTHPPTPHSAAL